MIVHELSKEHCNWWHCLRQCFQVWFSWVPESVRVSFETLVSTVNVLMSIYSMKTSKMISHNQHDYRLIECSIEHGHTPACFELPKSRFYHITDAQLIRKADKTPFPTTNLHEFRQSHSKGASKIKKTKLPHCSAMLSVIIIVLLYLICLR